MKRKKGRKGRQYNNAVELDIAVCFCFHIIYVLDIYYCSQCVYRYYISFFFLGMLHENLRCGIIGVFALFANGTHGNRIP